MIAKWIKQLFTRKPPEEWVTVAVIGATYKGIELPVYFEVNGNERRVTHEDFKHEGFSLALARIEWERFGKLPAQAVMIEENAE